MKAFILAAGKGKRLGHLTKDTPKPMLMLNGKPFQAFTGQDHRAHTTAHLAFMATNMARNNPMVIAALEKNVFEHISMMAPSLV